MELISLWWPPAPTQRCALIVCWLTHVSNDQRYRWLNDVVRVGNDEVRPDRLLIDIADLIWEPPLDDYAQTPQRSQSTPERRFPAVETHTERHYRCICNHPASGSSGHGPAS